MIKKEQDIQVGVPFRRFIVDSRRSSIVAILFYSNPMITVIR